MSHIEAESQGDDFAAELARSKAEVDIELARFITDIQRIQADLAAVPPDPVATELAHLKAEIVAGLPRKRQEEIKKLDNTKKVQDEINAAQHRIKAVRDAVRDRVKTRLAMANAKEVLDKFEQGAAEFDIDGIIQRFQREARSRQRRARQAAYTSVAIGAIVGSALIWIAIQTNGFPSAMLNALGTGMLTAGTVGAAGAIIIDRLSTEPRDKEMLKVIKQIEKHAGSILAGLRSAEIYFRPTKLDRKSELMEEYASLFGEVVAFEFKVRTSAINDDDPSTQSELQQNQRRRENLYHLYAELRKEPLGRGPDSWFGDT